jgi:hypothetical protein
MTTSPRPARTRGASAGEVVVAVAGAAAPWGGADWLGGDDHVQAASTAAIPRVRGSQAPRAQFTVDEATDTWTYTGEVRVNRHSEWHRTDAPCRAVNARARYRYEVEEADRLPFSLRLLENHRKGLCPYCFYGGPAGINPNL